MSVETGKEIKASVQRPFDVLDAMRNEMNKVFHRFEAGWPGLQEFAAGPLGGLAVVPRLEVRDENDRFIVEAELPGAKKEDVEISVSNGTLRIKGSKLSTSEKESEGVVMSERSYGAFERAVPLGGNVDADSIDASFENGVLTVTAAKRGDGRSQPRRIEIRDQG